MAGNQNDLNSSTKKFNNRRRYNLPHVVIAGGMAAGLGTAIVTGFRKSTKAHAVSSLCFVGFVMLHFFMHYRKLSYRMKTGLRQNLHTSKLKDSNNRR